MNERHPQHAANITRTGTCHYRSMPEAKRAYGEDCEEALKEGRIAIGKPTVPVGCHLQIDRDGRYWVCGPAATFTPE